MRTVDILVATIALFSDKNNWTTGCLTDTRIVDEETTDACFCALGGLAKSGGCLQESPRSTEKNRQYSAPEGIVMGGDTGVSGVRIGASTYVGVANFARLSRKEIARFASLGAHPVQVANAQRYLTEAIKSLLGYGRSIYAANDYIGYDFIMKALRLAAKNAKRRHITGDRKKASTVQAVSQ